MTTHDWTAAVCAQTDPELFHPEIGGNNAYAKSLCRSCPLQAPCLDIALNDAPLQGIWGGMSSRDRQLERKRLGIKAGAPIGERSRHGTRACYLKGCRLPECVEANREYGRRYTERKRMRGAA